MRSFIANFTVDVSIEIEIEANSLKEAFEKANKLEPLKDKKINIHNHVDDWFLYSIYDEERGETTYEDECLTIKDKEELNEQPAL